VPEGELSEAANRLRLRSMCDRMRGRLGVWSGRLDGGSVYHGVDNDAAVLAGVVSTPGVSDAVLPTSVADEDGDVAYCQVLFARSRILGMDWTNTCADSVVICLNVQLAVSILLTRFVVFRNRQYSPQYSYSKFKNQYYAMHIRSSECSATGNTHYDHCDCRSFGTDM
jgi:hypothetical protein